ncbi:MAG: ABC transporter substrate-binding protein [Candidatus Rokuibacteriota bacterium]|nr:MAG: ABC transporter substrate-binding protein [Candidatus Rokubacteria bacterium]
MARRSSLVPAIALLLTVALAPVSSPSAAPEGQITFAVTVTLAPTWFDPAETPGVITPFLALYALHDALVKPMPGNAWAPGLAESWSASKDGLTYEFVLRKGVRFHNGDPLSAEDVKFSFERYKGGGATTLKARVAAVEIVDLQRVRFRLKQPWPDFMTFYATPATSAAWIVPKKYLERVGDDGFKKLPVGAGPYRFVSFNPGVELVVEAYDGYWRKAPAVKRLVFKSVPDESTRVVMLRRGETDIAYGLRGPDAEQVKRTPGLTLKVLLPTVSQWLVFTEQWDPKSPWADRRVRLAVNLALDRQGFSDAEYLGYGRPASSIIPRDFEFYWMPPAYPHDPARARRLLAEAGYPRGFDAVEVATDVVFAPEAEAVINGLQAIGIRARLRPMERAAFYKADQDKQFKYLVRVGSGAAGNAATRIEAFVISGGIRSYGGYPDIDALFRDQAGELDARRREALLHRIQQLMHERVMFAPIVEQAALTGVGPRLTDVPTITGHPFVSPYEDLRLR